MKVLVFGLGVSGKAALEKLTQQDHELYVVNQGETSLWCSEVLRLDPNIICKTESEAQDLFGNMDLIIVSPGVPRKHPYLQSATLAGIEVISEIEFAFRNSQVPVIAVTGTNGKTTTCKMIAESLRRFKKKVFLGGNIGHAYSHIIGEHYDFAIIEVSSFQLEFVDTFAPIVSVITNITPSHMERYENFEDYRDTKLNLLRNRKSETLVLADKDLGISGAKPIYPLSRFSLDKSKLVGEHNRRNFYCAYEICHKLCENFSDEDFQVFIDKFSPVAHRLEFLGEKQGKLFYNDSKSTNLRATITAIEAFNHKENICLIIGGKIRQEDLSEYAELEKYPLQSVLAFGEARNYLPLGLISDSYKNLEEAVAAAKNSLASIVLFSPGFPSFDQFRSFEHRGESFKALF